MRNKKVNEAEKNLSKIQKCKQITTTTSLGEQHQGLKRTYQRYKNVSKSQLRREVICQENMLKRTYQRYKNVSKSQLRYVYLLGALELKRTYQRYKNVSKSQPENHNITYDVNAEKNLSKIQKCKQITTFIY